MKFDIETAALQRAVTALGVVVQANTMDATGRFVIKTDDDSLVFTANNTSTAITINVPAITIDEPGEVSLTYSKIKGYLTTFKVWNGVSGVKKFNFVSTERYTYVKVENIHSDGKVSKSKLKLTNSNPALLQKPPVFKDTTFVLNSSIFRDATSKVLYAIDPTIDSSLKALQGLNIAFDENDIRFVGANGKVLSEWEISNTGEYAESNVTLEYNFIMALRRLLSNDIQLFWDIQSRRAVVKFDDIIFSGKCIVGHEYPAYRDSLDSYTHHINFSKELLIETIAPFVDTLDPDDNFRLTFEIKDKKVRIFNNSGSVEVEQDIQGGLDFSIDVNGKLFIQTIDAVKDDYILFKFSTEDGLLIFDASTTNNQKSLIVPLSC